MAPADPEGAGKRAAQVARRIEAEIIRRGWPVGESLGSEAELQQRYAVSRSVLREAVRLVEHHRVARMQRGPGGGLKITTPDAGPATRAMVIYLEYLGITTAELLDARLVLEPLASALAAEHIDETGIVRLRNCLGATIPARAHDDFHLVLADVTGNPALALFVEVLTRLTARYARGLLPVRDSTATEAVDQLTADHDAIVEAVTAGDVARARTLTAEHVQTVTGWLQRHPRAQTRRTAPRMADGRGKRAEVLAALMHDDIAAAGWPTGAVFGTEPELLERYQVSRSVLREAVRLLEFHTVARMRRGPGGGLIVTEPQPRAAIETIALYLEYRQPQRDDLRLVREAIEISSVAAVVARREDADVRAYLAAHADDAESGRHDPRQTGLAEFYFHTQLTELAGNRVLNLFLAVLVELFRRHWTSTMAPMPEASDAAHMRHAHQRIIEAIDGGDDSMAQHRLRRHLAALSSWWV